MLALLIVVIGSSMEPAIHSCSAHDQVPTPYRDLHRGMIVNYINPFTHLRTCHRIVAGWSGYWVVKGDANQAPDRGYCKASNYIGQVL